MNSVLMARSELPDCAIAVEQLPNDRGWEVWANLDWPTKITETEFFRRVKEMPKGKSYGFLSK